MHKGRRQLLMLLSFWVTAAAVLRKIQAGLAMSHKKVSEPTL